MRAGIAALVAAYVLSQFYRAFLAVMAPVLKTDLGIGAEDLAAASGLWFLTFAAAQIPVGSALDRIGPRRTAAVLFGLCAGGGALVFAAASSAWQIQLAMALIGVGCSPVLMATYYIFARTYAPAIFGTLAGAVIGIGNLGNIAGSLPLAWAVESFGWRETLVALAAVSLVIAGLVALLTRDPERVGGQARGSVLDLLRMPAIWPILAMMSVAYMPPAALRGLWAGPYYADVFGADTARIGQVTLAMGLAMVAGNFAYGPLDRLFRSRKRVILTGNLICAGGFLALWAMPAAGGWVTPGLMVLIGLTGATFAMIVAHGRAFFPPHLVGRGVTLINLFGMGSVGISQMITGRLHAAVAPVPPEAPYQALFLFYALVMLAGCAIYLLAQDRTD